MQSSRYMLRATRFQRLALACNGSSIDFLACLGCWSGIRRRGPSVCTPTDLLTYNTSFSPLQPYLTLEP